MGLVYLISVWCIWFDGDQWQVVLFDKVFECMGQVSFVGFLVDYVEELWIVGDVIFECFDIVFQCWMEIVGIKICIDYVDDSEVFIVGDCVIGVVDIFVQCNWFVYGVGV